MRCGRCGHIVFFVYSEVGQQLVHKWPHFHYAVLPIEDTAAIRSEVK